MGTVKVDFSGDITNLQKCYQGLVKENTRLEQAMQRLAGAAQQSADVATRGLNNQEKMLASSRDRVLNLATSWVSVQSAIQLASAAMEHQMQLGERMRTGAISTGASQWNAMVNMANLPEGDQKAAMKSVSDLQKKHGFKDINMMFETFGELLSSNSGNVKSSLRALEGALPLTRIKPEELLDVATGGVAIQKNTGESDPVKAYGTLLAVQQQSRPKGLHGVTRYGIPSAGQVSQTFEADKQKQAFTDALAMYSALTNVTEDSRGQESAGALISLNNSLRNLFTYGVERNHNGRHWQERPFGKDPGTLIGRIESLQSEKNKRFREEFLRNSTFEMRFKNPMEQLLDPKAIAESRKAGNKPTIDYFYEARPQIKPDVEAYNRATKMLATGTPQLAATTQDASQEAAKQQADLKATALTRRAMLRKVITDTLSNLDSKGVLGHSALYAQNVAGEFVGQGASASWSEAMLQSADKWTSSERDKETIANARRQLAELVGERPKNLYLQSRGVNQLSTADDLRKMQRQLMKDNRAINRDQLSPFNREAFDELQQRIFQQSTEEGGAALGYQVEEGNPNRRKKIAELQSKLADPNLIRKTKLYPFGKDATRAEQLQREIREQATQGMRENRTEAAAGFSGLNSDDLFYEHQKAQAMGEGGRELLKSLPTTGAASGEQASESTLQRLTAVMEEFVTLYKLENGMRRNPTVPAGAVNRDRAVHSER